MRCRRRCPVLEAELYDGTEDSMQRIVAMGGATEEGRLYIQQTYGSWWVDEGDWVIKETDGTLWLVAPGVFKKEYEVYLPYP